MLCLSETYLDSSYTDDGTQLNVKNFILITVDNHHNCKLGGVCIYFKENLAVGPISPLNLNERLALEINIQNKKKKYVISLYQSLSQSKDKFDQFLRNFEQLILTE